MRISLNLWGKLFNDLYKCRFINKIKIIDQIVSTINFSKYSINSA